jgi:hypothetical protein
VRDAIASGSVVGCYCFDGETARFNPFLVPSALGAGCITETELSAASSTSWFGLTPAAVLEDACFMTKTRKPSPRDGIADISSWEAGRVHATPLLLQTGMLSLVLGRRVHTARLASTRADLGGSCWPRRWPSQNASWS